ncbi:MAG: recombination-mediator protein [Candidatus Desulfovibrio kirbyi]|uniref:Recombination-mediator protein n=1 Tax=Candidatus Desulfovibrio kirbyi TaxID=2696086 RepID=A0A6L2R6J5_9BACT|nr:MAG: recombination-mediator protein [Candidatus Desulfovibrio kirbyi]
MPAGSPPDGAHSSAGGAGTAGLTWAAMDEAARAEYWASLALRYCSGLGACSCAKLLKFFDTAHNAFESRDRWREAGLTKRQASEIAGNSWRAAAKREWDSAKSLDCGILLWSDPLYPQRLREISDSPVLLYCRGDTSLLRAPAFAVVGSRQATAKGLDVAAYMSRCLSACGIAIVSGMALGIDRVAHEAALARPGGSIGVLGTGVDTVYPKENARLFEEMPARGLLLSEFAPGTPPLAAHFPVRNRIISALSLGVLVVEAASRSGSLVTARLALEQNREVYAVPGQALDTHCLGCQELVRQGAKPVFTAEDVLRDLADLLRPFGISEASLPENDTTFSVAGENVDMPPTVAPPSSGIPKKDNKLCAPVGALISTDQRRQALACLRANGPMHADDLSLVLGVPPSSLSTLLVALEMIGEVKRLAGARYKAES